MSGQMPDEAARLEVALARIARGAARARHAAHAAAAAPPSLPPAAMQATHAAAAAGPDTLEVAARLDQLIAELRAVLGTTG